MTDPGPPKRRRIVYISPGLQGGIAVSFAAVVVVGAALFALLVYHDIKDALWDSSYMGHFRFKTPYQIVDNILATHLAVLFLGVLVISFLVLFLMLYRIRSGIRRVIGVLEASGKGDLSTPTNAPGVKEIGTFGRQLDAARARTLFRIEEVRGELAFLSSGPPPEEFRRRWALVREKIGRIVP